MLLNQFHDILPGSSIEEVYEVTKKEYEQIAAQLADMTAQYTKAIAGDGEAVTIFNTTGITRDDVANLGDLNVAAIADNDGNVYPVQKTADGSIVYVEHLPSKGYQSFVPADAADAACPFTLHNDRELETPFYTVRLDEQGMFTSIYDKENDREVVQEGSRANLMRMYEDKPIYFDCWDIVIY